VGQLIGTLPRISRRFPPEREVQIIIHCPRISPDGSRRQTLTIRNADSSLRSTDVTDISTDRLPRDTATLKLRRYSATDDCLFAMQAANENNCYLWRACG
jgi:hypothetical protein